ncbi:hypothetical protein GCM10027406_20520 [Leifsonia lichenia]
MIAAVLAGTLAFSGLGVLIGPPAAADDTDNGYTHTFLVDDARDVADADPGDGACATRFTEGTPAVPTCTMYAAVQEANALPAGDSVLIAVAPSIRNIDGSFTSSALIQLNWNTTNNPAPQVPNMSTSMAADSGIAATIDSDTASRYWVKHDDVTIDLQGRLGWTITTDVGPNVLLFTGTNQTLRNFTNLVSAESGVYVGSTAKNFSLVNGRLANPASTPGVPADHAIERGIVIVEGAKNTTITNVHFQRAYWDSILLAPASDASLMIDGLTVDRSSWDQPVNGGAYDPVYNYFVRNWSSAVSGRDIAITNSDVRNWGNDGGASNVIYFSGGTWQNVSILGNRFTGTSTQAINPIAFNALGQTSVVVRNNDFIQATGTRGSATGSSWVRNNGSTVGVRVFDNRVEGGNNRVQFANVATAPATAVLPVFRNTMSGVGSTVTAANENVVGTTNNIYNSANGTIRTAYALSASAPQQSCEIDVEIAKPSTTGGTAIPTDPVFVDVYIGRSTAAGGDGAGLEQYLGRVVTTQSALPATFQLPYAGAGDNSVVRLQTTEIATGKTSQYSRSVPAVGPDTCAPQSWIKQGGWYNDNGTISSTQQDPTSFRDVRFQIRTSEPLGGAGLTAADIAFSGTAPGQQVVSLTALSDTSWELIAKANGSGTVVPSIPQGAIQDVVGQPSLGASNSTRAPIDFAGSEDADQTQGIDGADIDHSVLYNSPLAITAPDPLALSVGEPGSESAGLTISNTQVDADGRVTKVPSSPVTFTQQWSGLVPDPALPDPGRSAAGIAVALPTHTTIDDAQPTMDTIDRSVNVPVRAIDNQVVDGTRHVTLGFAVSSDDPEFDGLELPTIPVTVTDDDHPSAASSTLAVTANGAIADGTTANTVTVTVRNAADQPVSNATVLLDVPDGTTWVGPDGVQGTADDLVGGAGTTISVLTDDAGQATLDIVSSTVGSYQVAALVNGSEEISGSPQTVDFVRVTVDPSAPGTAFTVSPGDVVADGSATHTITVTIDDVSGNPATGWESAIAATAAPASGVVIGAFAPTGTAGEYAATVTATTAGTKTIAVTVDDGGTAHPLAVATGGRADAVFVAGPPAVGAGHSTVSIDDDSDRVADGSAFHQLTVVLVDANGNPVTGAAAQVHSTVAGVATGAVAVTGFTESSTPGTYEALVRSTAAGAHDVTVTFGAAQVIGTVAANFAAGGVDLGDTGSSFSVSSGDALVGSGHHTVTVTLADTNGNPVSGQAAVLSATTHATLGTGSITGFAETATPGTYQATVTSTVAGDRAIDVRLSGDAVTVAGNGTASFVAGDVDLADSGSRFTVSEGEVAVGTRSHGITVTLADQYGNPVSGRAGLLLASTADDIGGGTIGAFAETATPGSYLASITSTVSGGKTIAVTFAGDDVALDGNGVATFASAGVDPDNVGTRFAVSTGDETVGSGAHTVTVTLADGNGNPVSGQAAGIEASSADDLGTGTIGAFAETATPGTYTATITSTVAGRKTVSAVFGADRLTVLLVGNDVASFVAAGVDLGAGASGYSVTAGSRPVGTGEHTITATLVDGFGNPVQGQAAELTASTVDTIGAGAVSAFTETATAGTYAATVSSTVAGAKHISVALTGAPVPVDGNGIAHFAAGGVDLTAGGTVFSVSEGDVSVAGGTHSVTVTLTDAYGNPVVGQAPPLAATTADDLGSGAIGPFVETTPGSYAAAIASSVAGEKTVSATFDGLPVTLGGTGNDVARFIAGGVDIGNVGTAYSVSGGDEVVGSGAHTITVTLADADGNPVSGQAAGVGADASDIGAGTISGFTETATPGTYTATVSATVAGSALVTVTFGGSGVRASGNIHAVFVAGPTDPAAAGSGYTVSGGEVSVDGGAHTVTVTLTDSFGNPASGSAASLLSTTTAALGGGTITGFTETATAGTYTATITSSVAGSKAVTTELGGTALALHGNGDAVFIAGGADPDNVGTAFSVSTGDQVVGSGSHTVTVTLADSAGNPVSGQAAGLSASSLQTLGAGAVSAFAETAAPGTYTASITSTIARSKTILVAFGGTAVAADGNHLASFVAGDIDLTAGTTGYAVSTGEESVDGGSHQVLVYLTDAFGNAVSGDAAQLTATTADDLGTGAITGFVETAIAGEYAATITSSVAGDKAVDAAFGGSPLAEVGNSIAQFRAGDVDLAASGTRFTVSTGDQAVGASGHTIAVTLTDAAGNSVADRADQLTATTTADLGAGGIGAFTEVAPGKYEATITSTVAGDKPVDVHYGIDDVSGPVSLAADGNGSARFAAGAVDLGDAASAYTVSSGDAVVVDGTHTVTVTLADQYGNPVPGQAAALSASTADDLGTGGIAAFTETGTPGTYAASITSSVAGAKTIAVALDGAPVTAAGNTVATFVAGGADTANPATVFTVSAGDQPVGTGAHTITVTLADANGNPVSGQAATLVGATTDPLGSGAVSGFAETATPGRYTATVTSTSAGAKTIAVSIGGSPITSGGNAVASFVAGTADLDDPASGYSVSTGTQPVGTGVHAITVTLADQHGNPVAGRAGDLLAATTDDLGSGAVSAFAEAGTAGTYTATVTSSVAGGKAITVTLGGLDVHLSGNGTATFASGGVDLGNAGSGFAVSTGPASVDGGSHTVTVALADAFGNPVSGQAAALTAAAADLGSGVISGFAETATAGTYTATITSTVAGAKAVGVTLDGNAVTATGNAEAVFAAAAVDLGNAGSAYTVSSGAVSVDGGSHAVTITLADRFGNPVTGEAGQLTASTEDALGTGGITDVAETGTPGTYSATATSSVAGTKAVVVHFGGQTVTLDGNGTAEFVSGGVDPANPGSGFAVTSGDQPVGTGQHTVTVTLADANGNPVSGQAAGLTAASTGTLGGGGIGAFAETATPGTYTAAITSTVAGTTTMSVAYGGSPLALAPALGGNGTASFTADGPDPAAPGTAYTVSIGDQQVGTGAHTVTVTLSDAFGNPVPGQADAIVASTAAPLGTGTISAVTETATSGTYTATVTSTVAGAKAVAVTISGTSITATGNDTATFVAGAPDAGAAGTRFTVTGGDVPVVTGSHLVTITLADQHGNPVGGQAANLLATTDDPLGSGGIAAVAETATPGTYTATVSSSVAGQKTVSVTVSGQAVTAAGNAVASFVAGGVDVGNAGTVYSVSPGDQTVGTGTHTVTVALADAAGNPVSGQAAAITAASADDLGMGGIGAFAETPTAGVYSATVASTVAGGKAISAAFGGSAITLSGNGTAAFVAGAADPAAPGTAFSVSTGDQPVGTGGHTITATVTDGYGNPVSGQAAELAAVTSADLGSGVVSGFAETAQAGTYTATVTSTVAGAKALAVTLGGAAISADGNASASFAAGAVDLDDDGSAFSVSGGSVTVGTGSVGSGSHTVTVRLADEHGNPVSGQAGMLAASTTDDLGTGVIGAFAQTAPGVYEAHVTSSVSGDKTVTVVFGGAPVTLDGNGTASFVSGGVDVTDPGTGFAVSDGAVPVDGGSHTVTVTLSDSEGNPVTGMASGLSASAAPSLGSGTVGAFVETATPGTYTAIVTSSVAGGTTIAVRFGGDDLRATGNTTAAFTAGGVDLSSAGTGYRVSTGGLPVGGAAHTVTVTLTDASGNPVSGAQAQLAAVSAAGLGGGAITAFAESAPGVYLAQVTSTSAGAKPIAVGYGGAAVTLRGNGTATFVAGAIDPAATTMTATSPVRADGTDASVVTVSVFDRYGNPVTTPVPVTVASTIGAVGQVISTGDGRYTASITSTVGGTAGVTATVGGAAAAATASVLFVDVTGPLAPVLDPSDGATVTGCAEPGSTIQVRDADGTVIGEVVAGADCRFEIVLQPPLAPGDRITVTATDPDGNVSSGAALRVGLISMELAHATREPGQQQVATGHGFQPGELVRGRMQSTPVDLGTQVANAHGDVTFTFTIASDAETGVHTVTLTGGFSGSVSERFTVTAPTGLADTGSDLSAAGLWIAALAVGLGLALLTIVSRRRRDAQKGKR